MQEENQRASFAGSGRSGTTFSTDSDRPSSNMILNRADGPRGSAADEMDTNQTAAAYSIINNLNQVLSGESASAFRPVATSPSSGSVDTGGLDYYREDAAPASTSGSALGITQQDSDIQSARSSLKPVPAKKTTEVMEQSMVMSFTDSEDHINQRQSDPRFHSVGTAPGNEQAVSARPSDDPPASSFLAAGRQFGGSQRSQTNTSEDHGGIDASPGQPKATVHMGGETSVTAISATGFRFSGESSQTEQYAQKVSFSPGTVDNEATSHHYTEKLGVAISDIYRGKISAKDAYVKANPVYEESQNANWVYDYDHPLPSEQTSSDRAAGGPSSSVEVEYAVINKPSPASVSHTARPASSPPPPPVPPPLQPAPAQHPNPSTHQPAVQAISYYPTPSKSLPYSSQAVGSAQAPGSWNRSGQNVTVIPVPPASTAVSPPQPTHHITPGATYWGTNANAQRPYAYGASPAQSTGYINTNNVYQNSLGKDRHYADKNMNNVTPVHVNGNTTPYPIRTVSQGATHPELSNNWGDSKAQSQGESTMSFAEEGVGHDALIKQTLRKERRTCCCRMVIFFMAMLVVVGILLGVLLTVV